MRPCAQPVKRWQRRNSTRYPCGLTRQKSLAALYNTSMPSVPAEIHGQRYISLATFRKNGAAVYTPIWFAEDNNKLYFMTSSKTGKYKRIRNNPQVKIAPCTIRKNHRSRIPRNRPHPASGRVSPRPPVDKREILARPCPLPVAQHRHCPRNYARIRMNQTSPRFRRRFQNAIIGFPYGSP